MHSDAFPSSPGVESLWHKVRLIIDANAEQESFTVFCNLGISFTSRNKNQIAAWLSIAQSINQISTYLRIKSDFKPFSDTVVAVHNLSILNLQTFKQKLKNTQIEGN